MTRRIAARNEEAWAKHLGNMTVRQRWLFLIAYALEWRAAGGAQRLKEQRQYQKEWQRRRYLRKKAKQGRAGT